MGSISKNETYTEKLIESLKNEIQFLRNLQQTNEKIIAVQEKQINLLIGNEFNANGSVSFLKIVR